MPSVVIAAHNEENLIGATLQSLAGQDLPGGVEVVVSANGCTDRTAEVARAAGVAVVDRPEPGKPGALNAGDRVATSFPRVYLDADIVLPQHALRAFVARLAAEPAPLVVIPRRRLVTTGRPWPVRAYFAINERLPVFRTGLFGRGVIVLSEEGRKRFGEFPTLVADDLFLDSLFTDEERAVVPDVEVSVEAPYTTRDLLRRLERVRRGNAQMREAGERSGLGLSVRRSRRWSWLTDVVARDPRLIPAAIPYVVITLAAAVRGRRRVPDPARSWGRDESTRGGTRAPDGRGVT